MSLDATRESIFQNDIIQQMLAQGWQLGTPQGYNRETALYEQDVLRLCAADPKPGLAEISAHLSAMIPNGIF